MTPFELSYVWVNVYTDPKGQSIISRILTCKSSEKEAIEYAKIVSESEAISAAGMSLRNFETVGFKCPKDAKLYIAISTKTYQRWL